MKDLMVIGRVKLKNYTTAHLMEGFVEELMNKIVGSSSGWVSMEMKKENTRPDSKRRLPLD